MRELVSFIAAAAMVASVASCGPAEDETQAGEDQAVVAETSAAVEEISAPAEEVVEVAEVVEEVAEEAVEVAVEEVAESVEEITEPVIEPIEEVVEATSTSGDAEEGQVVYTLKCGGCHAVEVGVTRMGPTMVGLYGSKSGMTGVDVTWDAASLDAFLAAPKALSANIMMTPLADAKQRLDVIAYLETLK